MKKENNYCEWKLSPIRKETFYSKCYKIWKKDSCEFFKFCPECGGKIKRIEE